MASTWGTKGSLLAGVAIRLKSRPRDMSLGSTASSPASLALVEGVEAMVGGEAVGSLGIRGKSAAGDGEVGESCC